MKEIRGFAEKGITGEELQFTKSSIGQSEALKYESPMQKAGFLARIQDYSLPLDYIEKQNEILKSITVAEINAIAKKRLPHDKMVIVVVGDRSKVYDGLVKLGFDVIEMDPDGNPLKPVLVEERTSPVLRRPDAKDMRPEKK
jgi:zinc protease